MFMQLEDLSSVGANLRAVSASALHDVSAAALLGVNETFLAQQRQSMLNRAVADLVTLHERPLARQQLARADLARLDHGPQDVR